MPRLHPSLPLWLGFVSVAWSGGTAATRDDLEGLIRNSPFANPAAPVVATPQTGVGIEFRGVFADHGEYFFSLTDPAVPCSMWVGLKEPGNPFFVRSYDATRHLVTIDYQGRTLTLALKQAQILVGAAPTVAPAAAEPPASLTPAAKSPPVEPTVESALTDESDRLKRIAEDIRRRRADRKQAQPAAVKP